VSTGYVATRVKYDDGNFEADSLCYSQPTEADQHIGDVVVLTNLENEPSSSILSRLEMLYEADR